MASIEQVLTGTLSGVERLLILDWDFSQRMDDWSDLSERLTGAASYLQATGGDPDTVDDLLDLADVAGMRHLMMDPVHGAGHRPADCRATAEVPTTGRTVGGLTVGELTTSQQLSLYTTLLTASNLATETFGSPTATRVWMAGAIIWLSYARPPRYSEMAYMTGVSRKTARRVVQGLIDRGYVHRQENGDLIPTEAGEALSAGMARQLIDVLRRLEPLCDVLCPPSGRK